MKLNHSVLSGSDGGSLWRLLCSFVHPKTQHLKILFGADIVYIQQQVISNDGDGPQLLNQGCVYAYRWLGLFPLAVTWTEGESETACSERLFRIFLDLKKLVGWFLPL